MEEIQSAEAFGNYIKFDLQRSSVLELIEVIEARDKLICKAQKKACSNEEMRFNFGFAIEDKILNAPDAI